MQARTAKALRVFLFFVVNASASSAVRWALEIFRQKERAMNRIKQLREMPHDFAIEYGAAMTLAPRNLRDCMEADARPIRITGET